MAKQYTLNKALKEVIDMKVPQLLQEVLTDLATVVVNDSPSPEKSKDSTGAYIMSHKISTTGSGRSLKRQKGVIKGDTGKALAQLMQDIASVPDNADNVVISNRSPHANIVESGGRNWKRSGYYVYSQARNVFPNIVAQAVAKVKDK